MRNKISKVYNLIILDASGSMESIKAPTIKGFNDLIESIQSNAISDPRLEQWLNVFSFNSKETKEHVLLSRVENIAPLSEDNYIPDLRTPLYDAVGFITSKLERQLLVADDYLVLVTILTDGYENDSVEYSLEAIAERIKNLSKRGWVFTYIGANHDVERSSHKMNIQNYLIFDGTIDGIENAVNIDIQSRNFLYSQIQKEDINRLQNNYFQSK